MDSWLSSICKICGSDQKEAIEDTSYGRQQCHDAITSPPVVTPRPDVVVSPQKTKKSSPYIHISECISGKPQQPQKPQEPPILNYVYPDLPNDLNSLRSATLKSQEGPNNYINVDFDKTHAFNLIKKDVEEKRRTINKNSTM